MKAEELFGAFPRVTARDGVIEIVISPMFSLWFNELIRDFLKEFDEEIPDMNPEVVEGMKAFRKKITNFSLALEFAGTAAAKHHMKKLPKRQTGKR